MDIHASGINAIFGKTGHFLVIIAFMSALLGTVAYATASMRHDDRAWKRLGRFSFLLNTVAVMGVIALLLFMIRGHMFEYAYVWRSSNMALPMRFLLSSFWEGQEGSTLLWMFWIAVIGVVLIFTARKWEAPVMVWLALAQALLGSMILGMYIFGYKMGSSPFQLLKDYMDAPVFRMNPGFVPEDGSGLNPLLQNYWMTIHPPTLFLGYALSIVPFAFAMASLLKRSYKDWVRPALPWTLAAVMVLGVGILMGGAWAYEALSFGGFWAWDPVENASLVPWLLLVGGLHTLLAYKHSGYSLSMTYILFIASFLLVLYASFLTKSGVLGDSSVHSFTDMGMSGQLVVMMVVFALPALVMLFLRRAEMPRKKTEERLSSREFWLFIGSAIFVLSSLHITVVTSFPVINKIFGTKLAPPSDIERMFNDVQIWIGILVGVLLAFAQFLNYRFTDRKRFGRVLLIPAVISVALTVVIVLAFKFHRIDYILLAFAGVFGTLANGFYAVRQLRGKFFLYGGSVAHTGIALMLVGILISQGKQEVVSYNQYGVDYGSGFSDQDKAENLLLYLNEPSVMREYRLTYIGDSVTANKIFFKVLYEPLDGKKKPFVLTPHLQMDENMGNVANPSTRRTLTSDLYTHITAAPIGGDGALMDSTRTETFTVGIGDTVQLSRSVAIVDRINPNADTTGFHLGPDDMSVGLQLRYITLDSTYLIEPRYLIRDRVAMGVPLRVPEKYITFTFARILPETAQVELTVTQRNSRYIIMKAIVFPYINVLWLGAVLMAVGLGMSVVRRSREKRAFDRKLQEAVG